MSSIAVVLSIWAICGLISAYLHRDAWGLGWIGGFILGPVGIIRFIIIAIQYPRDPRH